MQQVIHRQAQHRLATKYQTVVTD